MLYNLENTIDAGRPVQEIHDKYGKVKFDTIEVDTVTGRCVRCVYDNDGSRAVDDGRGELPTIEVYLALPVKVIFQDGSVG